MTDMTRISVAEFVHKILSEAKVEAAGQPRALSPFMEACRLRAETTSRGCSVLLVLGSLSARMDGLPSRINLWKSRNDAAQLVAQLLDGRWRLDGDDLALAEAAREGPPSASVMDAVLQGMGLLADKNTMGQLSAIAGWGDPGRNTADTMAGAVACLDPHVVRAVVAHRQSVQLNLLANQHEVGDWIAPCWSAAHLFGPHSRVAGSLLGPDAVMDTLAHDNDDVALAWLLNPANIPPGRCAPDMAVEGANALRVAVGRLQLESMVLLLAAGVDPATRDGDGRTLLHHLANGCWLSDTAHMLGIEDARMLLEAGVDPRVADNNANLPSDYLRQRIRDVQAKESRQGQAARTTDAHPLLDLLETCIADKTAQSRLP